MGRQILLPFKVLENRIRWVSVGRRTANAVGAVKPDFEGRTTGTDCRLPREA